MTHCLLCKKDLPNQSGIYGLPHLPFCQHCYLICGDDVPNLLEYFNYWDIEKVLDYQLQFYDIEEMDGGVNELINDLQMDEIWPDYILEFSE